MKSYIYYVIFFLFLGKGVFYLILKSQYDKIEQYKNNPLDDYFMEEAQMDSPRMSYNELGNITYFNRAIIAKLNPIPEDSIELEIKTVSYPSYGFSYKLNMEPDCFEFDKIPFCCTGFRYPFLLTIENKISNEILTLTHE